MPIEKLPRDYNASTVEKIITSLVRRIEALENAQTVKKIGSLSSSAAPLLGMGELGFVRSDAQNIDLVLRGDDGRLYRFSGIVSASSSVVSSPAGPFVLLTGDTMTGALVIDGSADAIQLRIQGHSTQTNSLLVLEDSAGNDQVTVSNDGAVVVNEEGNDADFRVESDGDANALYVDASANTVQIGAATASDSAKFYVSGKLSTSGEAEINGDFNHDGSNIGVFGVTPAARAAATDDIKDALTTYGLLQGTSASPLNLDGGALICGAFAVAYATTAISLALGVTHCVVTVSATATITLPTAVGISGRWYIIKNIGSGITVTIATTSSQTIDGVTSQTLTAQYSSITVVSDNANWHVI